MSCLNFPDPLPSFMKYMFSNYKWLPVLPCIKISIFFLHQPAHLPLNNDWSLTMNIVFISEPDLATITVNGILHYIAKECQSRKENIRRQFWSQMQKYMLSIAHCMLDKSRCKLKNVEVTCRKGRNRRSVNDNNKVDISFDMELPFVKNASADVNDTVAEVKSSVMETINKSLSKLEVDGQVITLDKSSPSTLKFVSLTCGPGQVLKGAACGEYLLQLLTISC